MSKQNKLLASIETDIKIEKGLKILEFATQYYLTRTYLRSTPLNYTFNPKKSTLKQQEEYATIIAQLNEQIIKPKNIKESRLIVQKPSSVVKLSQGTLTSKILTKKKLESQLKAQTDAIIQKSENSESSFELPQNSKRISKKKNSSFQASGVESKLKKSQNEFPSVYPLVDKKVRKVQLVETSKSVSNRNNSFSLSQTSKDKSAVSSSSLNTSDFNSYHSQHSMKVIKQVSESAQDSYIQAMMHNTKPDVAPNQQYSLQDFSSINYGKISIGNSTMVVTKPEPLKKFVEKSLQTSNVLKEQTFKQSQKLSFLDRSFTQIHQSDSKSAILNSQINQTQKSFLRHISDSFVSDEKIKTLIKLQNLELQQKHLLQRMQKRFQNCANQINEIRSLNWSTLDLPPANITFKRPNYAHCIQ